MTSLSGTWQIIHSSICELFLTLTLSGTVLHYLVVFKDFCIYSDVKTATESAIINTSSAAWEL